jgi:hypothetical protein
MISMSRPLYEITYEYQNLMYLLDENELPEEEVIAQIEEIDQEFDKKASNITGLFLNIEAEARSIKEMEVKMKKRRDSLERNAMRFREYLLQNMIMLEIPEVKKDQFLVKVRNCPHRVELVSESLIPDDYKETVESIKIDKTSIKQAMKNGILIPGALLKQSQRLDVR